MRRFSILVIFITITPIAIAGCGQQKTPVTSWIWSAAVAVGTIALAVVAAFSEEIKKAFNRTKLRFKFAQAEPDCHEITMTGQDQAGTIARAKSYWVRFRVYNDGRNAAENVEVFLSDVFRIENGNPQVHRRHIPLDLKWANKTTYENMYLTSINREFHGVCNIGFVIDPAARCSVGYDPFLAQQVERELANEIDDELLQDLKKEVAFTLDTVVKPNNGSHFLFKGDYILRLRIGGSNVKTQYCYFQVHLADSDPNDVRYKEVWGYYLLVSQLSDEYAEGMIGKP